ELESFPYQLLEWGFHQSLRSGRWMSLLHGFVVYLHGGGVLFIGGWSSGGYNQTGVYARATVAVVGGCSEVSTDFQVDVRDFPFNMSRFSIFESPSCNIAMSDPPSSPPLSVLGQILVSLSLVKGTMFPLAPAMKRLRLVLGKDLALSMALLFACLSKLLCALLDLTSHDDSLYDEEVHFNLDDMDEYDQWEENIVDAAANVQAYDGEEEKRLLQKQLDDEAHSLGTLCLKAVICLSLSNEI
ncbi:hypothetical protein BX616_005984, partial [Lobosporangium transversale]